jgi:hypothetical protein
MIVALAFSGRVMMGQYFDRPLSRKFQSCNKSLKTKKRGR